LDLSSGLKKLGYDVIKIVARGEDLIKEAYLSSPEIIVSDIHLKDNITGVEAIKKIKIGRNAGIILISGYNDPHTLSLINEVQPCIFLRKPTTADEISQAIETSFNGV
jgi:DNA-binding NarL/FixJ family response regulator